MIVKLRVIRRLNYRLPCSQPRNMAPTYQSFEKKPVSILEI
jgi:hypothetical protein